MTADADCSEGSVFVTECAASLQQNVTCPAIPAEDGGLGGNLAANGSDPLAIKQYIDQVAVDDVVYAQAITEVLRVYSANNNKSDAIDFLEAVANDYAHKLLAAIYIENGNATKVQTHLNALDESDYHNENFIAFYNLLWNVKKDGRDYVDLSPSELMTLNEIALSGANIAVNAQSLLAMLHQSAYERIPYGKDAAKSKEEMTVRTQGDFMQVYPNPSTGTMVIETTKSTYLRLYSITGEQIQAWQVAAGKQQINLNVPEGIYLLNAVQAQESKTVKIIVSK